MSTLDELKAALRSAGEKATALAQASTDVGTAVAQAIELADAYAPPVPIPDPEPIPPPFPAVSLAASGVGASSGTAHKIRMPADVASGKTVVVAISAGGAAMPAGEFLNWFTPLGEAQISSVSGGVLWIGFRRIDGSEPAEIGVEFPVSVPFTARVLAIDAAHPGEPPAISIAQRGSASTIAPPALLSPWGEANTLWLTFVAQHGFTYATAFPADYADTFSIRSNHQSGAMLLHGAARALAAEGEQPGVFKAVNKPWAAVTLAIRPAVGGGTEPDPEDPEEPDPQDPETPVPPPLPSLAGVTVTPTSLPPGGGAITVQGIAADADAVTINGVSAELYQHTDEHGVVTTRITPFVRSIDADTTIVIVATNETGSAQASQFINVEDPPAEPPPPASYMKITRQLNLAEMVTFKAHAKTSRYQRHMSQREFIVSAINEPINKSDYVAGGAKRPLEAGEYRMHAIRCKDWNPHTGAIGPVIAKFVNDGATKPDEANVVGAWPAEFPDGHYMVTLAADTLMTGESFAEWDVILDRHGEAKLDDWIGDCQGNYAWVKITHGFHTAAAYPMSARGNTALPLPYRPAVPFTHVPARKDFIAEPIVAPSTGKAVPRLGTTGRGNPTLFTRQSYAYSDISTSSFSLDQPIVPGPRGIATCCMPTYVHAGRDGKAYIGTAWGYFVFDKFGTSRPLVGLYQPTPVHWPDARIATTPRRGEWTDGTPYDLQWLNKSWGMVFDPHSVRVNEGGPIIDGENPHFGDVVMYATSILEGGVVAEVRFNGDGVSDRFGPPRVKVLSRQPDAWGLDMHPTLRILYCGARKAAGIAMIDADSGEQIGWFQQGPVWGSIDREHVWRGPDLEFMRRNGGPCPGVETVRIAFVQGELWCYWSAKANGEVRRQRVGADGFATGEIETCLQVSIGNNSNYLIHDVSQKEDGFVEEGMIAFDTWGLSNGGFPPIYRLQPGRATDGRYTAVKDAAGTLIGYNAIDASGAVTGFHEIKSSDNATRRAAILANARKENGTPITNSLRLNYEPTDFELSYPSMMSFGHGALLVSSAMNGLHRIRLRRDDDEQPIPSSAARTRGATKYIREYLLTHGYGGNHSAMNFALPFGENADLDAYMNGFERVRWAA